MQLFLYFLSFVIGAAAFYFTGVGFGFSGAERAAAGAIALVFTAAAARRGAYQFFVTALTGTSVAAALGTAFGSGAAADASGPLTVSFELHPWAIFLLGLAAAGAAWYWDEKSSSPKRFAVILLTVFIANWIILAFNVRFFDDWKLENYLTVPFVILLYVAHRSFKLSNASYGLIFAYMMLHIFGSHYTYSEVPLGDWMAQTFDMARNHYDRIVHFSFGFLLAYPMREVALRITAARGFWGLYIPVEFVLAFSALYEILEWLVAVIHGGDLGIAYLGTQGDEWDAIKDMGLAGLGAFITMVIVAVVLAAYRRKDFWAEIRDSLRVRDREALGEHALHRLQNGGPNGAIQK